MPRFSVIVDNDVETVMTDGIVLRSTVYRPASPGRRFPVLLTRTPYGRDLAVNSAYFNPTTVAAAGYVVVIQDCRGRFGSDGAFEPSIHEADDGAMTVAWAGGLPYSNGSVGMWGRSYFSETQWRAATRRPPVLRAMALGVSAAGNANNGSLFRGGAHEFGSRIGWGHASAALNELHREFSDDPERRDKELQAFFDLDQRFVNGRVYDALPISSLAPGVTSFVRRHVLPSAGEAPGGTTAAAWDEPTTEPVPVATLHIGGWFDIFLPSTLAQYRMQNDLAQEVDGITPRLIVGPWSHSNFSGSFADVSFGMPASAGLVGGHGDLSRIHTAFFDATLKGETGALECVPPVLLFVMGENTWRGYDELPEPTGQRAWYLGEGGALLEAPGAEATASYVYDPADPVPTVGGATMIYGPYMPGPADQFLVENRDDVLTFTTETLEDEVTVYGPVKATFHASSSAPDTDFVARLCRVAPDGRSYSLADGIVRASWRDSLDEDGNFIPGRKPSPLEPGRVYEFTVSLWSTAYTFAPGDRLRVQVTSSCHPRWDRNPNTGALAYDAETTVPARQTLHFGTNYPSRLTTGTL